MIYRHIKNIFAVILVIAIFFFGAIGIIKFLGQSPMSYFGLDAKNNHPVVPKIPADSEWLWVRTQLPGRVVHEPRIGKPFIMKISADNRVNIEGDCNSLFGTVYTWEEGDMAIPQLASTKKFCEDSQEMLFISDITRTTAYTLLDNTLTLTLEGDVMGYGTMTFMRVNRVPAISPAQ